MSLVQHRPPSDTLKSKPTHAACEQHVAAHSASPTPVVHVMSWPEMCDSSKQLNAPHELDMLTGPRSWGAGGLVPNAKEFLVGGIAADAARL